MRIVLLSCGSRGDATPFVSLAQALQDDGHDVVLAVSPNFKEYVEGEGVRFEPIGADTMQILKRYKEGGPHMMEEVEALYAKVQYDAW